MASQLMLEDSGLQYEAIAVNTRDPQAKAEYAKTVNPKGQVRGSFHELRCSNLTDSQQVPALFVDGEIITEAPAILTAISQLAPEKHYTGKTPLETVRFYEWINYLSGAVHGKAFTSLFVPSYFSDDPAAEAGIKSKATANVLAHFASIEEKLAALGGPTHALGDSLTGVDAYLVIFIRWAKSFGMDLSPFPNYIKLFESLTQTPAYARMNDQNV